MNAEEQTLLVIQALKRVGVTLQVEGNDLIVSHVDRLDIQSRAVVTTYFAVHGERIWSMLVCGVSLADEPEWMDMPVMKLDLQVGAPFPEAFSCQKRQGRSCFPDIRTKCVFYDSSASERCCRLLWPERVQCETSRAIVHSVTDIFIAWGITFIPLPDPPGFYPVLPSEMPDPDKEKVYSLIERHHGELTKLIRLEDNCQSAVSIHAQTITRGDDSPLRHA